MKIVSVQGRAENLGLTRPYTIAFRVVESVENVFVEIGTASGLRGLGAASPEPRVTGETFEACRAALTTSNLGWLLGRDAREISALCGEMEERHPDLPAARAAVDTALHDLFARNLGLPLADALGRAHDALATSITIGIKDLDQTLAEAAEYVARGFRVLKVKIGIDLETDLERVRRLRESVGPAVGIRVDANQGYTLEETIRFFERSDSLAVELVEQPVKASESADLAVLPARWIEKIAADESLVNENDALALAGVPPTCGIFNIKLMKCGGIRPALRIATIAETAELRLMWGCMDESRISIAAALHAAFASPATRYLDLDGSLDLARDVVRGGFLLENGVMRTTDRPGLGVEKLRLADSPE